MDSFAGLEEICLAKAPLGVHTTYRLGGPARWLLTPRDETELAAVLHRCRARGLRWLLLGRGANVLIRDRGVDAAVIRLTGPTWEDVRWEDQLVYAAAGADFTRLVRHSVERGLAGLEGLAGIPGSVGGVVHMNAGGRYGNISECTRDVRVMDETGRITTRAAADVGFGYRCTNLGNAIVLGATFKLAPGDRESLIRRFQDIWKAKYAAQPAVQERTAGCIFKNPAGESAGRLLDDLKLKGVRIGGAEISRKHANFIVARQGASSQNVLDLIALARERVRERAGLELELEVKIW